jgi:hypothetical protein
MSDKTVPKLPEGVLSQEQIERISGGDCTFADIQSALSQLQQSYDTLVDFTSYVIERVVGP